MKPPRWYICADWNQIGQRGDQPLCGALSMLLPAPSYEKQLSIHPAQAHEAEFELLYAE
jgi:hypothetical protein